MRRLLLVAALAACTPTEPSDPPRADEPRPSEPKVVPTPGRQPEYSHKTVGKIAGEFVVPKRVVRVAEPIMASFEARSLAGPLVVAVGGDQRNAAYFPMRVAVKVERIADQTVVCDSVESPAIMSFGGPGFDRTLAEGELLRESFVLNPICPALATPGSYRVTLHRRMTSMQMVTKQCGADVPTSCDVHPLHEESSLEGLPAECVGTLREVPSVTTTFELAVLPYDRSEVKTAIDAAYARADAAEPKDDIANDRIDAWLCGWVSCACQGLVDGRTAPLPDQPPEIHASGCRAPVGTR